MRASRAMTEASNFMRMVVLGRDCPSTSTECAVTLVPQHRDRPHTSTHGTRHHSPLAAELAK